MKIAIKGNRVAFDGWVYRFDNADLARLFYQCIKRTDGNVEACSLEARPESREVDSGQLDDDPSMEP